MYQQPERMEDRHKYILKENVQDLITRFWRISVDAERQTEKNELLVELKMLCRRQMAFIGIDSSDLLLVFMDAYEVTRDEEMLQKVLNLVSGNLDRLEVSVDSVKLLAYCYYYVEEEECAERAGNMLKVLKQRGENSEGLAEAEKVLEELT